jgi:hypothetical protein
MARWLLVLVLTSGCTNSLPTGPACITVQTDCQNMELYPPTFDNVYNNTLSVSCGSTNSSCHSSVNTPSGMSFVDEDTSYSELLEKSKLQPSQYRVVPGNPGCSVMIVRTDSPGEPYQMPIGNPLGASERCSLIEWVAMGAPGPGQGSGL